MVNRSGCVFAAVNYQKAPEHKFPIPLDDCYAALIWVSEHAGDLGIDPARIGVAGDSSGGNLAAAVCLRARDDAGPAIACQALICPVLDYGWDRPSTIAYGDGYLLQRDAIVWFWGQYLRTAREGENP